jgi:integrase
MTGGHIRQRSPGSWEIRYRVNDRTRTETIRGTKRDAQRRLRELLVLVDQNRHPSDDKLTVSRWLDRWLGIVKEELATQTYLGYEAATRVHIKPALGDILLSRLLPIDIQNFYSAMAAGKLQASTARRICGTLVATLNRAAELRLIISNPADAVRRRQPRAPSSDAPLVLDRAHCEQLLAAARDRDADVYVAVLLGLATGMRRNEILALDWQHVDLAEGQIHVEHSLLHVDGKSTLKTPKNGEARTVTIPAQVVAELRRLKLAQAEALLHLGVRQVSGTGVCCRADGTIPTPRALSAAFERLAKRAAMPACNFHVLRHSHASELLRLGVPVHAAAQRLGHKDGGALLKTYAHTTDAVDRDAAARIGDMFSTKL